LFLWEVSKIFTSGHEDVSSRRDRRRWGDIVETSERTFEAAGFFLAIGLPRFDDEGVVFIVELHVSWEVVRKDTLDFLIGSTLFDDVMT